MQGSGHGSGGGVIAGGVGLVRLRLGDGALQVADGALLIGAVCAGEPLVLHGIKGGFCGDRQLEIFHTRIITVPSDGTVGAGSNGVHVVAAHITERLTGHSNRAVFVLNHSRMVVVDDPAVF